MAADSPVIAPPVRRRAPVMGTVASIHVHDDAPSDLVHAAIDDALTELERLEAMFSTYRADSVVSAINRGERNVLDGPAEVIDVLDACTWLEQITGGAFRARRPEPPFPIDPAGFVKGWATERASAALERAGLRRWCFSVGGDLIARGRSRSGQPWRIAVADPSHRGQVLASIPLSDAAVATSGTSERGHHVWDGRRSNPATDLASLTVIGPHLTWADAFATAAFALGAEGLSWVEQLERYEAMSVDSEGRLATTTGLVLSEPAP
ncbi:MAG TPA: FAD:protein FMN transferase [Acidimicrobiales bacterium]